MPKRFVVERAIAYEALQTLKHPRAPEVSKDGARRSLRAWLDDPKTLGHPLSKQARAILGL